ncbi:Uncharacterised protein [Klebsiella pneumoniae]|nr:Uncharacterised protein [Klebsiella pneumoniae]SWJ33899.1 Uncharacterised protein [Klebsiella pneumoniae]
MPWPLSELRLPMHRRKECVSWPGSYLTLSSARKTLMMRLAMTPCVRKIKLIQMVETS